ASVLPWVGRSLRGEIWEEARQRRERGMPRVGAAAAVARVPVGAARGAEPRAVGPTQWECGDPEDHDVAHERLEVDLVVVQGVSLVGIRGDVGAEQLADWEVEVDRDRSEAPHALEREATRDRAVVPDAAGEGVEPPGDRDRV